MFKKINEKMYKNFVEWIRIRFLMGELGLNDVLIISFV